MNSKAIIPVLVVVALVAAGAGFYYLDLKDQKTFNATSTPDELSAPAAENVDESQFNNTEYADDVVQPDVIENDMPEENGDDASDLPGDESTQNTAEDDNSSMNAADANEGQDAAPVDEDSASNQASADIELDYDFILSERGIGDPGAKVVIREHSSLTCGHCGAFHQNAYNEVKSEYIDTGKVYWIFDDFPLNAPALEAGAVARCLPENRYFNFLQLLFTRQDQWAYDANYRSYLKQNAQLAGLSAQKFDACINDERIKQGIVENMKQAQSENNVNSTPTLVINSDTVISGSQPFSEIKKTLDQALADADAE